MLVVGASSEPWLVPHKDEAAFVGFWSKMIHVPLPDYASRQVGLLMMSCVQSAAPRSVVFLEHLRVAHTCTTHPTPAHTVTVAQVIWPGLFARHGATLPWGFDLSTLAHLSEGYAPGDLAAAVAGLLASPARRERLVARPLDVPEVLEWLCKVRDEVGGGCVLHA